MPAIIPDTDHVVRYCTPGRVDKATGMPKVEAFLLRVNKDGVKEPDLSMNWLEKTGIGDPVLAMDKVRSIVQVELKENGRFAAFNAGIVRSELARQLGPASTVALDHAPTPQDCTHSIIHGYRSDEEDLAVAATMAKLVRRGDGEVLPGIELPAPAGGTIVSCASPSSIQSPGAAG